MIRTRYVTFDEKTDGKHGDTLRFKYCLYVKDYKHGDDAKFGVIPERFNVGRVRA